MFYKVELFLKPNAFLCSEKFDDLDLKIQLQEKLPCSVHVDDVLSTFNYKLGLRKRRARLIYGIFWFYIF
jgi:hypothetical protein